MNIQLLYHIVTILCISYFLSDFSSHRKQQETHLYKRLHILYYLTNNVKSPTSMEKQSVKLKVVFSSGQLMTKPVLKQFVPFFMHHGDSFLVSLYHNVSDIVVH